MGPTAHRALDPRALIGGAQPQHGWWAPVTQRNIKRWGAGGTRYEVRREPATPPTHPSDLGFRDAVTGSTTAATAPLVVTTAAAMANASGSSSQGEGYPPTLISLCYLPLTCLDRCDA